MLLRPASPASVSRRPQGSVEPPVMSAGGRGTKLDEVVDRRPRQGRWDFGQIKRLVWDDGKDATGMSIWNGRRDKARFSICKGLPLIYRVKAPPGEICTGLAQVHRKTPVKSPTCVSSSHHHPCKFLLKSSWLFLMVVATNAEVTAIMASCGHSSEMEKLTTEPTPARPTGSS